jgi:hypothetical protein
VNRQLDLIYVTLIAELAERALDAQFDADFDASGLFKKRTVKGRDYWYFRASAIGNSDIREKYVGPADDPEITRRVENFSQIKADYKYRQRLISTLVREARLFRPDQRVAAILEALARAGIFRMRACLVGTVAYQTYGTVLGYRLPDAALQTGDIDIAQFHSVSLAVDDTIAPILDVLKSADPTFRSLPSLHDDMGTVRFSSSSNIRVEFLTPNRGSDDHTGKPAKMPSLGGAAAEPLRSLDFLIREPVRTVILANGGIPVTVPDPARYAVHKLIVAERRVMGTAKELKDLAQARNIAEVLRTAGRLTDLQEAFEEARGRGPKWEEALSISLGRLETLGMKEAYEMFGGTVV